jgi:hypothetical protein
MGLYAPHRLGRAVQVSLFVLMGAVLPYNMKTGLDIARATRNQVKSFERNVLAGVPAFILAERHGGFLWTWWPGTALDEQLQEGVADSMRKMRDAGIRPYGLIRNDPDFREVSFEGSPATASHLVWTRGAVPDAGKEASLALNLKQPRFVYAIRLKSSCGKTASGFTKLSAFWGKNGSKDFTEKRPHDQVELLAQPGDRTVTIWVNDTIDEIRLHANPEPTDWRISKTTLLVPMEN